MTTITLASEQINTIGTLPAVGSSAPDFTVVDADLNVLSLKDFAGKRLVLNIFPSIDTGVCAQSVREFNKLSEKFDDVVVLCVSKDLPFASARFCAAEGLDRVVTGSAFRSSFGEDYGVTMVDGGLAGLLARAVVIVDADGKVIYTEQVPEIKQEPDYDAALAALQ